MIRKTFCRALCALLFALSASDLPDLSIHPGRHWGIRCNQLQRKDISFGVAAARALSDGKVDGFWANALGCELAVHLGCGSLVLDTRRGDGPAGSGNYSSAALATTESNIQNNQGAVEAVIRALVRAQSVIRQDPQSAAKIMRKLFPPLEAELMGQILPRDAEFYRPSISIEAIDGMNRFATAIGLLASPVSYEQVVATQFQSLWSK